MKPTPDGIPRLVEALARIHRKHRVARKLLVAPNHAAGRELLRRLSLTGDGWIGFEVTTPQRLAHRLAQVGLEHRGLSLLDGFEHQACLDRALDSALAAEDGWLDGLSEGVGFRESAHGAIVALRLAGIGPRELDATRFARWEKKLFLLRVLQRYERILRESRKADSASVMSLAVAALDDAGGRLPETLDADLVLLLPGLSTRGLNGSLIAALGARGAKVLETDPVLGLDVPGAVLWGRCGPPSPGSRLHAPLRGESDRMPDETRSRRITDR